VTGSNDDLVIVIWSGSCYSHSVDVILSVTLTGLSWIDGTWIAPPSRASALGFQIA
jgi:hypothetical protein